MVTLAINCHNLSPSSPTAQSNCFLAWLNANIYSNSCMWIVCCAISFGEQDQENPQRAESILHAFLSMRAAGTCLIGQELKHPVFSEREDNSLSSVNEATGIASLLVNAVAYHKLSFRAHLRIVARRAVSSHILLMPD